MAIIRATLRDCPRRDHGMDMNLHLAANGHQMLEFGDLPAADWLAIVLRLVDGHGCTLVGAPVGGFDSQIFPSVQGAGFLLAAGWDIWSGHYLLSESAAGDDFLSRFAAELGA